MYESSAANCNRVDKPMSCSRLLARLYALERLNADLRAAAWANQTAPAIGGAAVEIRTRQRGLSEGFRWDDGMMGKVRSASD